MVLVCQLVSQDNVMKQRCDFMDRSPSGQATILQSLDHSHSNSGVIMILVCHVITHDHMIKVKRGFMGESLQD